MDGGGDGDASVYSSNGQSIKRLKQALKTPCSCGCSCTMPFRLLSRICLAFWALPKVAQDSILWSVQSTGKRIKRTYSIEGILYKRFWIFVLYTVTWYHVMYIHKEKNRPIVVGLCSVTPNQGYQMCRSAWLRFLGIGKNRLARTRKRHRGTDDRSLKCGILTALRNYFFWCSPTI